MNPILIDSENIVKLNGVEDGNAAALAAVDAGQFAFRTHSKYPEGDTVDIWFLLTDDGLRTYARGEASEGLGFPEEDAKFGTNDNIVDVHDDVVGPGFFFSALVFGTEDSVAYGSQWPADVEKVAA